MIGLFLLLALLLLLGKRQAAPALHGTQPFGSMPTFRKTSLCVGVYNIHRARGTDGKKDLGRIARTISHADLIGLCECEGPPVLRKGQDQCQLLAKKLQLGALFSPTQKRWGRYNRGNGLLSRIPITNWHQEPLLDSTGTHARCLLRADIQINRWLVPVFVTHLARRIDQAAQLKTVIARFSEHERAILVGDFNLNVNDPQLKFFLDNPLHTDALSLKKLPDPNRIDWIICKGFEVTDTGSSPIGR